MTVPQNDRYRRYAPAAATTVMAYDFQIFDEDDIRVDRLRAGVTTTLVITTDYTVSGVGVLGGGNITLVAGSTAGDIYAIYGVNEYRAADYVQAGDFLAADVNVDMNKQMQVAQQLRRDVDTSIRLSPVDSSFDTADLTLPVAADRLDKYLKFDGTGDLELVDGTIAVVGTADEIEVTAGTIVGIADDPIIPGTARMKIPTGTTGQRSAGADGDLRYNTTTNDVEAYVSGAWQSLLNAGSGAPIGATYITQTSDGVLTNEQALSALATGIMKSTTGTGVVSIDASLTSLSALPTVADRIAYSTALNTWAETPLTAAGRALIDDASAGDQRTTLGLVIGTDVQAFDATLLSIAALGSAANKMLYTTGVDTWAEADITAAGRALLDDAAASDQRTTLGLGTMATQNANAVAIAGGTLAGIAQADVDNIRIDGNTISSTDANGNITIDPNGTGKFIVAGAPITVDEIATPPTPAANQVGIYAKADGKLYIIDDTGTETDITSSGASGSIVQLLQSNTSAASAISEFDGLFSSAYDFYIFYFDQVVPATDSTVLYCQLGTAGPVYVTANYKWTYHVVFGSGSYEAGNSVSDSKINVTSVSRGIDNATTGVNGQFIVVGPNATSKAAWTVGHVGYTDSAGSTLTDVRGTGFQPAATFTAIKFYFSSGNIASGIIRMYGIKNA